MKYPKWTFAKTGNEYWLILDKTKKQFISERAFLSWGKAAIIASNESLSAYKNWGDVGFAPGTVIGSVSGERWFITGSHPLEADRRAIETPDFYTILGFDQTHDILVSTDEINFHPEGEKISGI